MNNHALHINGETSIIHQAPRKLQWLSLPQLTPINKYYTKSNFVQVIRNNSGNHDNDNSMIVIDKNCINFLTVNLPPLSLGLFKQTFLDWQPKGGLCLSSVLILFDKHTINFYERTQNMKKTWTIEVMQEISQIQSSPQEKVIGMTVTEKDNTIFLWNLHDISNKPFQQVTVSQKIVKWEFYTKDMLAILTPRQLQVYYPREGQYNLQFFVQMAHLAIDFCFLDRPKTNEHTGRRSVYPVSILSLAGKIFIYELYDVDKRMKNSLASITATIQTEENVTSIICGFESENSQIILCAETQTGKPVCLTLSSQYVPKQKYIYLPELPTANPGLIQYCKQIICTQDHRKVEQEVKQQMKQVNEEDNSKVIKQYRLYKIIGKQQFSFIEQFECERYGILGGYNFFSFNKDCLIVYPKINNFANESKIVISDVKPMDLKLLQEKDKIAYFLGGVKIFRLDLNAKILKAHSFTVKNDRFKLVEVRNQTRSILYKSGDEFVLMQYQTPEHADNENEKVVVKTIKSSPNKLISLRNNRWVQKLPVKLIIGQSVNVLIEFDLLKLFKMLTQENSFLDYEIYWTTHDGIILMLKNYLFILELIQSPDGYSVSLIKRSNNYLHCRFSPDSQGVQLMDARCITVREGTRVIRFGTKLGNFVSEDPYSLPDTILRRQLLMRKIYAPHHPKVVQYLIQLGYFNLVQKMFNYLWKWLTENGKMKDIYQNIGVEFFQSYSDKVDQKLILPAQNLEEDSVLKKLCQKILQSPQELLLEENGGLILESQIEAFMFRQQNSRALDFFSESVITQFKTYEAKNESFRTMHIAYLLHSINKEEAVGILRQELQGKDLNWDWMKKYSIVLWYDVKTQIKNWAQEIGTNLFKVSKEPLDCLFWYTIAGKKNVLVQLFKKYLYNTSEHEKIFKFLQRDFNEPKNQNAAVNNAYVLMDKKRYEHALSFFIYGQKIDQAVSLCLNKLKDINLAFLICSISDDNTNRNKLIDTMLKEGDVWSKHIAYYYKNQHIDSFNCLFEEENAQKLNAWLYDPKLTNFHPCLKQFAEMIEKSIPIKRQLQEQQMKNTNAHSNDIFQSFFGNETETKVEWQVTELKSLAPNYQQIKKESVLYFMRNSCSILALMIEPENRKARRAYDLCQFLLTNQLNSTVAELIQEMEDYYSLIQANIKDQKIVKSIIQEFNQKFRKILQNFRLSDTVMVPKAKVGELMHYGYLGKRIIGKLIENSVRSDESCIKTLTNYIQAAKILLVLELEWYQNFESLANSVIQNLFQPEKLDQSVISVQFWTGIKALYDKIAQPKKNKKQNLYDAFEQSLYKYTFKKGDLFVENNNFKFPQQNGISLFIKKASVSNFLQLFIEKFGQNSDKTIVKEFKDVKKKIETVLSRWTQDKLQDQLQKQYSLMMTQGVVSKLKLTHLPGYLHDNFQPFCRGSLSLRTKIKKNLSNIRLKSKISSTNLQKTDIIEIFRNKQEAPKYFAINKNQGQGMELALLTKRGVKKLQVCDSLINRNRSQDGLSLVHDENYYNMDTRFDFENMFNNQHLAVIQKFLREVVDNRKEYDGIGVIKGSTKRSSPQYLKQLDPLPFFEPSDISCIECHHFLPIYLLGTKSAIQLCSFSTNSNYNRIKCTGMSEIVKVRSYQQRVSALDSNGNLGGFSFDTKLTGSPVFSLKKASVVDFCLMSPSTYGLCTNNSVQVIDSLLHPKRQVVFKTQSSQTPIAIDYFSSTKLAVCRRSELLIYDTRMDTLLETRDISGKAKCISSNYRNKVLVGRMDNKIKIFDVASPGPESDYEIKMISGKVGSQQQAEKSTIEDIQIMGKFAVALNSEGSVGLFNIQ